MAVSGQKKTLSAGLRGSIAAVSGTAGLGCVENEGFTVHALGNGGVLFVSADHNTVKGTEISGAGVVCTLGNGAGDRMIGLLLFHFQIPSLQFNSELLLESRDSIIRICGIYTSEYAECKSFV